MLFRFSAGPSALERYLSAVRLIEIVERPKPLLRVGGLDLLDGTPVIDIKPYLPYADAMADASGGFAQFAPDRVFVVNFSPAAKAFLNSRDDGEHLRALVFRIAREVRNIQRERRPEADHRGQAREKHLPEFSAGLKL